MAYDEGLAERIRDLLPKAKEKKMFGGAGWMERGNMVVGVWKDSLLVRVPPEDTPEVLKETGVSPFIVGGKSSKGWVLVDPEAIAEEPELTTWVERSRKFAKSLPAK